MLKFLNPFPIWISFLQDGLGNSSTFCEITLFDTTEFAML